MKVGMKAILIVALVALAVIGAGWKWKSTAGWKWGNNGVPKAVGWTLDSAGADDGDSSHRVGWTW
jgi:hypothetical protein